MDFSDVLRHQQAAADVNVNFGPRDMRGRKGTGPQTQLSLLQELFCDRHVARTLTAATREWQM